MSKSWLTFKKGLKKHIPAWCRGYTGLKVPFTTNGMERLMQEIGKRTKKKVMYWSEEGLQRIVSMVLKRYVLPKDRRTYIEIFANNLTEGIES